MSPTWISISSRMVWTASLACLRQPHPSIHTFIVTSSFDLDENDPRPGTSALPTASEPGTTPSVPRPFPADANATPRSLSTHPAGEPLQDGVLGIAAALAQVLTMSHSANDTASLADTVIPSVLGTASLTHTTTPSVLGTASLAHTPTPSARATKQDPVAKQITPGTRAFNEYIDQSQFQEEITAPDIEPITLPQHQPTRLQTPPPTNIHPDDVFMQSPPPKARDLSPTPADTSHGDSESEDEEDDEDDDGDENLAVYNRAERQAGEDENSSEESDEESEEEESEEDNDEQERQQQDEDIRMSDNQAERQAGQDKDSSEESDGDSSEEEESLEDNDEEQRQQQDTDIRMSDNPKTVDEDVQMSDALAPVDVQMSDAPAPVEEMIPPKSKSKRKSPLPRTSNPAAIPKSDPPVPSKSKSAVPPKSNKRGPSSTIAVSDGESELTEPTPSPKRKAKRAGVQAEDNTLQRKTVKGRQPVEKVAAPPEPIPGSKFVMKATLQGTLHSSLRGPATMMNMEVKPVCICPLNSTTLYLTHCSLQDH